MVSVDPIIYLAVFFILVVLFIGLILRSFQQPYVIGYILAGIFLGPHALSFVSHEQFIARVGEIGVVLMLFFVGMEVSLLLQTHVFKP